MSQWDYWVEAAISKLASKQLLRSTRPISLPTPMLADDPAADFEMVDGPGPWDRSSMEVEIEEPTLQKWLSDLPSTRGEVIDKDEKVGGKMLPFSGNDYLGLSSHPAVRTAAAKAAQEHGMGPRGSALICGYTNYHKVLEDWLLCPTGFAASMAFMTSLGNISSLLAAMKPSEDESCNLFRCFESCINN